MKKFALLIAAFACIAASGGAHAFEIPTGSEDVQWRWDNTLRYSLAQRVKGENKDIVNSPNSDDGDRNFNVGIVSNRLDLLSESDFIYKKDYGVRLSGAGWYDQRYRDHLDNGSAATSNHLVNGQPATGLNDYNKRWFAGPSGELLDAFAFGKYTVADIPVTLRVGRHTVYWGESMLGNGGTHGISYGQSAIDVSKALNQPGVELKELFRPRNQVSVQVQPTSELTLAANYYLQWESNRFPEPGTYLGFSDVLGNGSESLFLGSPFPPNAVNGGDITPRQARDWGVSARWSPSWLDGTFGVYYRNFSDINGQLALNIGVLPVPGAPPGTVAPVPVGYHWVYPSDIDLYGISLAKQIAGVSIGSEVSYRHNMPLWSDPAVILPGGSAPGKGDAVGAVGDTMHALVNFLYMFSKTPLFDAATGLAEFTYSNYLHVGKNEQLFRGRADYVGIDHVTKNYVGGAINFTPTWYQVMAGVDLSAPMSVSMGLIGESAVAGGGDKNAGQYGLGVAADIFQKYKAELDYVGFFGSYGNTPAGINFGNTGYSGLKDRDMVVLTLKTSF